MFEYNGVLNEDSLTLGNKGSPNKGLFNKGSNMVDK